MKRILLGCVLMVMCSQAYAGSVVPIPVGTALVYDGGGSFPSIQQAMTLLHVPYDLRGPLNPVTAGDLVSHDLLVVGSNFDGHMTGLAADVLEGGITGRKFITGHDADYHYVYGEGGSGGYFGDSVSLAAGQFFVQALAFAWGGGGRCGLLALGDNTMGFSYLPTSWGLLAQTSYWDTVDAFTSQGQASGVYDGLTPAAMSDWYASYHDIFSQMGSGFLPFEVAPGGQTLTVATPEPATMALLALGGLVAMARRSRDRK